jgi:hypothetical protein
MSRDGTYEVNDAAEYKAKLVCRSRDTSLTMSERHNISIRENIKDTIYRGTHFITKAPFCLV